MESDQAAAEKLRITRTRHIKTIVLPEDTPLYSQRDPRAKIFLDQYDWLLERARYVGSGMQESPHDLVQTLFISFVRMASAPDFSNTSEVQAYLRKSLRNLFLSVRMRQARDATSHLAPVDLDSLEFMQPSVDRSHLVYVRHDLARISEYVLMRRRSSKGATAFIMYFFFGYLPSEIMALLKLKRKTYEKMLLTARLEAKAYCERPQVLRFLHRYEKHATAFPHGLPGDSDALFAELQRRAFLHPVGSHEVFECLEETYSSSNAPLTVEQTAHLGSCCSCLKRACRALNMHDLSSQIINTQSGKAGLASKKFGQAVQAREAEC
jgi:DNA-directed RNA polymerase specialized sigma24 family protein